MSRRLFFGASTASGTASFESSRRDWAVLGWRSFLNANSFSAMTNRYSELLDRLAEFPDRIEAFIENLDDECVRWRPSQGEFSVLESIAHVRDLEMEATTVRIRRVLAESNPLLVDFDGTAVAEASDYNDEILNDALAAFSLARRRNVRRLRLASDADFMRPATYGDEGVTLAIVLQRLCAHDAEHGVAIEAIASRFRDGVDRSGAFDRSASLV